MLHFITVRRDHQTGECPILEKHNLEQCDAFVSVTNFLPYGALHDRMKKMDRGKNIIMITSDMKDRKPQDLLDPVGGRRDE